MGGSLIDIMTRNMYGNTVSIHNSMGISLVNFYAHWRTKIFVTMITGNFLAVNVHHVPSVARIVS